MAGFSMGFDPGSLASLARLQGFAALLNPQITLALSEAGQLLVSAAQAETWAVFANPTGALASSIYFWVVSPMEVDISATVPYARRREEGFSGMTDSLGRYFADDPAKPYFQPALDANREAVRELVKTGCMHAIVSLSGGA